MGSRESLMTDSQLAPDAHNPYEAPHLAQNPANHVPLTPLSLLE